MIGEDHLHKGHLISTLSQNDQDLYPRFPLVRNCSISIGTPPSPQLPPYTHTPLPPPLPLTKSVNFMIFLVF